MTHPSRAALLLSVALLAATPARSQDLSGTYTVSGNGTTVTLTLRQARNGRITGTLQGNTTFQVQAQAQGGTFSGYASNPSGRIYLEGQLAGDQLQVAMAEVDAGGQPLLATARTVVMAKSAAGDGGGGGGAAPADVGAPGKPGLGAKGGAGAGGAGSGSAQDRQIAQLLASSQWCTMTYSGVAGSTSGTTRYERVSFRSDGTGSLQTSGEAYSSGSAGIASGQSSGGAPFQWRVEGGVLLTTSEGASWDRTPLRISRNSNGYPIITANGKEYSMCN